MRARPPLSPPLQPPVWTPSKFCTPTTGCCCSRNMCARLRAEVWSSANSDSQHMCAVSMRRQRQASHAAQRWCQMMPGITSLPRCSSCAVVWAANLQGRRLYREDAHVFGSAGCTCMRHRAAAAPNTMRHFRSDVEAKAGLLGSQRKLTAGLGLLLLGVLLSRRDWQLGRQAVTCMAAQRQGSGRRQEVSCYNSCDLRPPCSSTAADDGERVLAAVRWSHGEAPKGGGGSGQPPVRGRHINEILARSQEERRGRAPPQRLGTDASG